MSILDKLKGFATQAKGKAAERGIDTDKGIDKAAGQADKLTGGKYSDKIHGASDKVKDQLGSESSGAGDDQQGGSNQGGDQQGGDENRPEQPGS